jgi:hypothetical protein
MFALLPCVPLSHCTSQDQPSRNCGVFYFSLVKRNESKGSGQNSYLQFEMDFEKVIVLIKFHKRIYVSADKNRGNRDKIAKNP